jgi:hypothetical protein
VNGIQVYQIKGQILFKGDIITKMKKWGGVIQKSSPELLGQF